MSVALSEWESKALLGDDVSRPREALTTSADEAVIFATELSCPVVAKASGVAHKSESGGIAKDLSVDGLRTCWGELAAQGDGRVLVAEQVQPDYELIVGGVRDAQFGPLLMVGFGGVLAELAADVSFFLAPPAAGATSAALSELRAGEVCRGYRGFQPLDIDALEAVVCAIADVLSERPEIVEFECNPIAVVAGAPIVLDALATQQSWGGGDVVTPEGLA